MTERTSVFERTTVSDVLRFAQKERAINGRGMMLCPLHDEKTPSFRIVGPEGRGWVCFGCDRRGGLVELICALGLANAESEAARWLEEKLDGPPVRPTRNDRPTPIDRTRRPKSVAPWVDVAVYEYRDAQGAVVYEAVRKERTVDGKREKRFVQRTTDEHGKARYSVDGVGRVLYRLPEIVEAVAQNRTIIIVEGEKDADRLTSIGFCATTNVGGAGVKWDDARWREAYSSPLRRAKRIVVIADCDEPGRRAASERAAFLTTSSDDVRMLDLDQKRTDGFDVSDWLDAGGTVAQLRALIESTKPLQRADGDPAKPAIDAVVSEPDWPDERTDGFPELPFIESASIVAQQPVEPIEYDIESIAPATDAPILLFGPPASYKSWLALAICDAIVRGAPFLGLQTRKRERALYVNLDAGAKTFRNRVRAISDAPGLDFISLSASQYSHAVLRRLLERYRGAYLVLDCLSAIYAPDTRNDPAHAMREFVDGLRALFAEFDCGGIVIDHPHRPKEKGELGDYHGSIQKEAAFRTMWSVAAEKSEDPNDAHRVKIVHRKLSEGPPFSPVEAELVFGERVTITRANGPNRDTKRDTIETAVIRWATAQTVAFSKRGIIDGVRGYNSTNVRRAVLDLIDDGTIVPTWAKRGGGELYRVALTGDSGAENHSESPESLPLTTSDSGRENHSESLHTLTSSESRVSASPIGGTRTHSLGTHSLVGVVGDSESPDDFSESPEDSNRLRDAAGVPESPKSDTPCGFHNGAVGEPCRRCGATYASHFEVSHAP